MRRSKLTMMISSRSHSTDSRPRYASHYVQWPVILNPKHQKKRLGSGGWNVSSRESKKTWSGIRTKTKEHRMQAPVLMHLERWTSDGRTTQRATWRLSHQPLKLSSPIPLNRTLIVIRTTYVTLTTKTTTFRYQKRNQTGSPTVNCRFCGSKRKTPRSAPGWELIH